MSGEDERAWARKRIQELETMAENEQRGQTAARQAGEAKLTQLQTRLEAIEEDFHVQVDGEDGPRATIVRDNSDVLVRWTRNNAILSGWFKGSAGENQTDSVDEAFDATFWFLKQRHRVHRTGT